jgi:hypothetical protein
MLRKHYGLRHPDLSVKTDADEVGWRQGAAKAVCQPGAAEALPPPKEVYPHYPLESEGQASALPGVASR